MESAFHKFTVKESTFEVHRKKIIVPAVAVPTICITLKRVQLQKTATSFGSSTPSISDRHSITTHLTRTATTAPQSYARLCCRTFDLPIIARSMHSCYLLLPFLPYTSLVLYLSKNQLVTPCPEQMHDTSLTWPAATFAHLCPPMQT